MNKENKRLTIDLVLILFSIFIAIFAFARYGGQMESFFSGIHNLKLLGSFAAGILFTSIFTAAPATVIFIEIFKINSLALVALLGALGAVVGDFIIFEFVKDRFADDIFYIVKKAKKENILNIFKPKIFRWTIPFVGALFIASPFPDEIGLMMMGLTKMKTSSFIPISFSLNFLGILAIGFLTKAAV